MPLTNRDSEDAARRLFRDKMAPAAESLRERGVTFFSLRPRAGSGWTPYDAAAEDELEAAAPMAGWLARQWVGIPELAELVGPLADLAASFRDTETVGEGVSPFIYVMF
jgi:hypothetical protein